MSIGFEEILGLLFFVFFVILPLFTKKGPPAQGGPAKGGQPGAPRPGSGTPTSAGRPAQQPVASAQPAPQASAQPQSWRELMQEVQRRVAQAEAQDARRRQQAAGRGAQAQQAADRGSLVGRAAPGTLPQARGGGLVSGAGGGSLVSSDPFEGRLVTSRPQPTSLGREGRSAPLAEAEPLQVSRRRVNSRLAVDADHPAASPGKRMPDARQRGAASTARLGAPTPGGPTFLSVGRDDLVRGLIWHEVLSEPAALKRLRRTRSQLH